MPAKPPSTATQPAGRKARIGIVEDEAVISSYLFQTLNKLGYAPLPPVVNYTEALALFRAHDVDLFLIDIVLAGRKSGIDLAQTIKESSGIPFIFITANAEDATMDRAMACRPMGFLVKPFDERNLRGVVESTFAVSPLLSDAYCISIRLPNGDRRRIDLREITHVETSHVYCDLFDKQGNRHTLRMPLAEFLTTYAWMGFRQIHKRFAVQFSSVKSYSRTEITLHSGATVPLGRTYVVNFREKMGET